MACFLVPAGLGIVTTAIGKKIPTKYHIGWLNIMLWGGVIILAVEHLAHQEVVPYPPFLTKGASEVIPEMLAVGVPMTVVIVVTWVLMVTVKNMLIARVTASSKGIMEG